MSNYDDRLKDYTDVKQRIALFLAQYPDGRLVTAKVKATSEPDGVPRVWVKAKAYRSADDTHPGVGWSWLVLPGSTPYTRGSEIENAETSAWGRAIGSLGIGIGAGIASKDEIAAKEIKANVEKGEDGSLIGIAEAGKQMTSDFLLRQTPEGPALGFRLVGEGSILVECRGPLATQLFSVREKVIGSRVQCWGKPRDVVVPPTGKKSGWTYVAIAAERVRVPDVGDLPRAVLLEPVVSGEPPEDVPLLPLDDILAVTS